MRSIVGNIFKEIREGEVASSVGTICDKCNVGAYYFKEKNADLPTEKICLICSKRHMKGVILEDFVFTLSRHIPNHYDYIEGDFSGSVSLGEIVRRFTYDNEQVVERLARLLYKENSDFFKEGGRYKDILDETRIKSYREKALDDWHELSREVKHTRRFTNTKATRFYEGLIDACVFHVEKDDVELNSALTKIDKGKILFRGRMVKDELQGNDIKKIQKKNWVLLQRIWRRVIA